MRETNPKPQVSLLCGVEALVCSSKENPPASWSEGSGHPISVQMSPNQILNYRKFFSDALDSEWSTS
jgi:hypothetical protein